MRTSRMEPKVPALGRVLFAPGALRVAMLLDFHEVFTSYPLEAATYAGLLVTILGSEILSYVRTRSWLIDYTDVPPRAIREFMSGNEPAEAA